MTQEDNEKYFGKAKLLNATNVLKAAYIASGNISKVVKCLLSDNAGKFLLRGKQFDIRCWWISVSSVDRLAKMSVCIGNCSLGIPKGQIQIIFGPMFSGKTTELIRRIKRYELANHKCLLVKYAKDLRYESHCGSGVATHDHHTKAAVAATVLDSISHLAESCSVIGIDEGQFFPDLVSFCEKMADHGKIVLVAALDGTYQRSGFGDTLNLVPLAEQIVKLTAVCMRCYGEAAFTQRLGSETEVELIGGTEKYMAVCRECYKKFADGVASPMNCHGNRMSSPFSHIQNPKSSPCRLKVGSNQPIGAMTSRALSFD